MKWLLMFLTGLLLIVAGLFYYYLYIPATDPPTLAGELRGGEVSVAGLRRPFVYYRPPGLEPGAPIVFALHGSTGSGEQARRMFGYRFDQLADQFGFVVVYPTGYENHWNDCRAGADYSANLKDIDDIAFFRSMIDYLVQHYGADAHRVLVTGVSNGGHMAYKLALEAPELVTAIAPIAAGLPVWEESDCTASRKSVPVAIINGTLDPINPYEGGVVELYGNDSRGRVMSSLDTAQYFADLAGHLRPAGVVELADLETSDSSVIELTSWQAPGLDEVLHYAVIGGGHGPPSRTRRLPRILGGSNMDINAADEIWDFFVRASAP